MCCHPQVVVVLSHIRNLLATLNILSHALGSVAPVVTALMLGHWWWQCWLLTTACLTSLPLSQSNDQTSHLHLLTAFYYRSAVTYQAGPAQNNSDKTGEITRPLRIVET